MVTSVFGMVLFSQCRQGDQFGKRRASAGGSDSSTSDGRIPRLVPGGERYECPGIEFDDVRRSSTRVTKSFDNLHSTVRWNAHFDGFTRRDSRELLQDESHRDCGLVTIRSSLPNRLDSDSTTFMVDPGKGHAQHASSGKGSVFT